MDLTRTATEAAEQDRFEEEFTTLLSRAYNVRSTAIYGHGDDARSALLAVLAQADLQGVIDDASTMLIEVTFGDKDFDATLVVVE